MSAKIYHWIWQKQTPKCELTSAMSQLESQEISSLDTIPSLKLTVCTFEDKPFPFGSILPIFRRAECIDVWLLLPWGMGKDPQKMDRFPKVSEVSESPDFPWFQVLKLSFFLGAYKNNVLPKNTCFLYISLLPRRRKIHLRQHIHPHHHLHLGWISCATNIRGIFRRGPSVVKKRRSLWRLLCAALLTYIPCRFMEVVIHGC